MNHPAERVAGVATVPTRLRINGTEHALELDPRVTLLDALREHLGLTGSKKGCDHGQCGACTVLVEGRRINACLTLAVMHDGESVTTVEGLAQGDTLSPLQAAFVKHDGFQCGYCTPGQLCSATGMLAEVRAGWPSVVTAELGASPALDACRNVVSVVIRTLVRDAQIARRHGWTMGGPTGATGWLRDVEPRPGGQRVVVG